MGESIIYRPRFRGSLRRLNFVEGWITGGTPIPGGVECGDNTLFPLEVTAKQLYEIMYGVKDAWFTSGSIEALGGSVSVIGSPVVGDPLISWVYNRETERAYSVRRTPSYAYAKHFLKEGYPTGIGSSIYTHGFEADNKERLMFTGLATSKINLPMSGMPAPYRPYSSYTGDSIYDTLTFRCGFHHLVTSSDYTSSPPTDYGFYTYFSGGGSLPDSYNGLESSLVFSGRVAWVDSNGSGDPFDPLNKLYVEMSFVFGGGYASFAPPYYFATQVSITAPLYQGAVNCDLVLQLSNSSVRCPLYYDIPIISTLGSVSDFVITAKKWWPYADYTGSPKFNVDTGLVP